MSLRFLAPWATLLSLGYAQVPIPTRPDGFLYGSSSRGVVVLEGFFDLMCPDTSAAWPVVKQVADHYGPSKLQFLFHTFPLPYHHNSYYANQGAHVVAASNASAVYQWMEAVFAAQDSFGNAPTAGMTANEVISKFADLAASTTGIAALKFIAGINDPNMDWDTRVSWKYGCSRYVSGTPTFVINGVQVSADPSWTLQQWMQLLDPFFATTMLATTCPAGQKQCEYLPGKTECCLGGESCIPNVGCRCAAENREGCRQSKIAPSCPSGQTQCEYLPGKTECCLGGESCIPNVGCRCSAEHGAGCRQSDDSATHLI